MGSKHSMEQAIPAGALDGVTWVYDRFAEPLYRFVLSRVGNRADADDVLQALFMRVIRHLPSLRGAQNLQGFLFQMARNEAARFLKRRKVYPPPDLARAVHDDSESRLRAQQYSEALMRLPEEQREVLVLKFYSGMTFREISEALELNPDTVASRYRYGLEKLREYFEETDDGRILRKKL